MSVRTRSAGGWVRSRVVADCTLTLGTDVRTLGVTGNGTDETTAMQAALDATGSGQTLRIPAGVVVSHAGVLRAQNAGMRLIGPGELRATNPATCSLIVSANNVTVEGGLLLNVPTQHVVAITGAPTGGTFTLSVLGQTTTAIAYNASAATVQAALVALSNVGTGNVKVTGGPGPGTAWLVQWLGQYVQSNMLSALTATGSFTGGTAPAVAVTMDRISSPRNSHRLTLDGVSGAIIRNVTSRGSAATGIRCGGTGTANPTSNYLVENCTVQWSRADGIHSTDSSHDGIIRGCTVDQNGDDSISIVSYDNDPAGPCYNIQVLGARVSNSFPRGRGLTVVGGHDIVFDDFVVTNSNGAGIYIACEVVNAQGGGFNTRSVQTVTYRNGTIVTPNQGATVYGAIQLSNTRPTADNVIIDDVLFENLTIIDCPATTSDNSTINRQTRYTNNPGSVTRICARNVEVTRGPSTIFTTDLPASGYRNTGWTRNGVANVADVGTYTPIR